MIYIFVLYAIMLIVSIIGIIKRVKWSWVMSIMWAANIIGAILRLYTHLWVPIIIISELAFFIQIIWIMLANKAILKEL